MNYNELTPQAQEKAIENYIDDVCAYADDEELENMTREDIIYNIEQNNLTFDIDGNII